MTPEFDAVPLWDRARLDWERKCSNLNHVGLAPNGGRYWGEVKEAWRINANNIFYATNLNLWPGKDRIPSRNIWL